MAAVEEPLIRWDWLSRHLDELIERATQHLVLTAIALCCGFVIATLLALVIRRWRWSETPIIATTTLIYSIPSIALFAALLPVLGTGLAVPAVALTLYSLVVLTPYLVAAFDATPDDVLDAADGLGYTRSQRFRRVELPLAVPVALGGVRVAAVTTIGLVTVGGLFDLGGFGNLIDEGLTRDFPTLIVAGVVGSVVFAVVADIVLIGVGRMLVPWRRSR